MDEGDQVKRPDENASEAETMKDTSDEKRDPAKKQISFSADVNADSSCEPGSKPRVEHVYRNPPVSDRQCPGEDRMEASLHYMRGRTDALLNQLDGPRAYYGGTYPRPNGGGVPAAQNVTIEASMESLRANKASLEKLFQQISSLRTAMSDKERADRIRARESRSVGACSRRFGPRSTPYGDLLADDGRKSQPQPRAWSATPSYRVPLPPVVTERPAPRPSYIPNSGSPLKRPSVRMGEDPRIDPLAAGNMPTRPSSYRRYLSSLRQNLMEKERYENRIAAPQPYRPRPRNRADPPPKFRAMSDYQPPPRPSRYDSFRPIQPEKPGVAYLPEPPQSRERADSGDKPSDSAPVRALTEMLDQDHDQDQFMDIGGNKAASQSEQ